MSIEIETGVPVPPKAPRKEKYPFSDLEVGQSFFVPNMKKESLYSTARAAEVRIGGDVKFTVRADTKDGVEGVRVNRTA